MDCPRISIVIPAHNEEENLRVLAREIDLAMAPSDEAYEIIFVDDASTDTTLDVLRQLASEDPRVQVLGLSKQSGQSAALAHGFAAARGEILVTLDADLQNDPADIPRLLAALEDLDMVIGVRAARHDSWVRRVSSRVANGVRSRILDDGASDTGCALKVMRAEVVARLPKFTGMHRFLPALVRMDGGRIQQVPVNHRPRLHGVPKYNIRNRLWRGIVDMFGVFWLQRRWIRRRDAGEVKAWTVPHSGLASVSSVKPFSSPASSSSGSPRNGARKASSPGPSGS